LLFIKSFKPHALSFRPSELSLMQKLVQKHRNAINQGGNENALGRFIAMGVDINGKQYGIGEQGDAADGRKQLQVVTQDVKIFADADGAAKDPKIINEHGKKRSEYTQADAES